MLERTLYVHVYGKSHLDQVLFSIGLVFMSVAAIDFVAGSRQIFVGVPDYLRARFEVFGISMGAYRLLIIGVCGVLTLVFAKPCWDAPVLAAACAPPSMTPLVARGLGINVDAIFA